MKFPSLKNLAESAKNTFRRFPFEVLFALAGTIAATINVELSNIDRIAESWCIRATMMGNLGLLLNLSASLYAESRGINGSNKLLIRLVATVIALLLLLLINPAERQGDYVRFFLLSLAFHLLVAYAAFTVNGHIQGFWQFNKTLFLRFLTSALYGGVLYLGLAAAIAAMNFLFNFKFEWDTFSILWIWIVGIFTTVFFLAGVPANLHQLDEDTSYPKGLKVFTQYVLIPLATVYVIILLAYEAKILVQWNLPKGYVSNIIFGYAVFGILALLLVYPIREREENKWLKTYARSFYFLLLPLLVLLFLAVGTRVFKYGITEPRYFLILLAVWLLFISIYFLFFKKQNIKIIPISLSVLTLLTIYGPQSAFSVAQYSQTQILVNIFKKNHAFEQGRLQLIKNDKIPVKDATNAVSKLTYLVNSHDLISLQPYIKKDLTAISDSMGEKKNVRDGFLLNRYELRNQKLEWIKKYLGLEKYTEYDSYLVKTTADKGYTFLAPNNILTVKDYDYLVDANATDTTMIKLDGYPLKRTADSSKLFNLQIDHSFVSFRMEDLTKELLKRADLKKYRKSSNDAIATNYSMPQSLLMVTKITPEFKITLFINNLSVDETSKKEIHINWATGTYFIKKL